MARIWLDDDCALWEELVELRKDRDRLNYLITQQRALSEGGDRIIEFEWNYRHNRDVREAIDEERGSK